MTPPVGDTAQAKLTLVIEASSASGSIALFSDDLLLQHQAVLMGASREDQLFPAIQAVLDAAGVLPTALSAIVCGSGPGSFTSLRIAAALAKGLAHATRVDLFAVPSLLLAAAAHDQAGEYVVHADALRDERYALLVHIDAEGLVHADADVVRITQEGLTGLGGERQRLSVGDIAVGVNETAVVADAARLTRVHGWRNAGPVRLDQWEPAYGRLAEAQVKWEVAHQQPLPRSPLTDE